MVEVVAECAGDRENVPEEYAVLVQEPPPLCADRQRPDKAQAIQSHISRFRPGNHQ